VLTVHCSWVQIAVSAVNVFCPVWATRNDRPDAFTSAAVPTADKGELVSMLSVIVLFTIVALTVDSEGRPLGDEGLLELPPHPVIAVAIAASDTVWNE
jgi:hypothetical protein